MARDCVVDLVVVVVGLLFRWTNLFWTTSLVVCLKLEIGRPSKFSSPSPRSVNSVSSLVKSFSNSPTSSSSKLPLKSAIEMIYKIIAHMVANDRALIAEGNRGSPRSIKVFLGECNVDELCA